MKHKAFRKFLLTLCAMLLSSTVMMAQSSGDRLYNQGLQLQKTMTVQAQNQAIAKFRSAKKLYDSAAKKSQCDQAITVSGNIISSLRKGKDDGSRSSRTKEHEEVVKDVSPTLSLTNNQFSLDEDGGQFTVGVSTNQDDWNVKTAPCSDGSSFLIIEKNADSFNIGCPENESSRKRTQDVIVSTGNLERRVTVQQTGYPVELKAEKNETITFNWQKTKPAKLKIYCNSDEKYNDNEGENWYVASKPDWINVIVTVKGHPVSSGKGVWPGFKNLFKKGKSNTQVLSKMKETTIEIVANPIKVASIPYTMGRDGEIILQSGDRKYTINVYQNPKK